MKISEKIRNLRIALDMTQAALADAAGIGLPTVRGIEQGVSVPTWPTLKRLADALGASLGDFADCEADLPAKKRKT